MPKFDVLRIGRTLGVGASSKVKVTQDSEGKKYAMKIFHSNEAKDQHLIEAEVDALRSIKHPRIVNLIEHGHGMW